MVLLMHQTDTSAKDVSTDSYHGRIRIFDIARGIAVVSMVLFHSCYDLAYLSHVSLPWFSGLFQDIWRASISWTFLFIAGCMCYYSHNNIVRGTKLLALSFGIYIVTTIAAVDTPISFGIIFCMGSCGIISGLLKHVRLLPSGILPACIYFCLFLITYNVSHGTLELGFTTVDIPRMLYETPWLSWLGFPGPHFLSGDYYPVIPYLFMYLTGTALLSRPIERGFPAWVYSLHCTPLEFIGRHALLIYVVHQPLLLVLTSLFV